MLITAMWYTRRQQPIRIGLWYTANGFGIAIGGLLGYGIGQIKGALASWKYEFLIIGALCCCWGVVMIIFLPDSPVTAPQLSEHERRLAVERLRDNQTGIENRNMKPRQIFEALTDWKVWTFFLLGLVSAFSVGKRAVVQVLTGNDPEWEYSKWRYIQFWNTDHQRIWLFDA